MFSRTSASGKLLLIMYVDDIIITGDDKKGIDDLKRYLQNSFQTKGLGKLCYFLGIEVARSKEGIILSQKICLGYFVRNRLVWIGSNQW